MPLELMLSELAKHELKGIRAKERRQIIDEMNKQLPHQALTEARNRKCLTGIEPRFECLLPIWESRVGEYRVFYDVDEEAAQVTVRAVRRKPPEKRTEDLLDEGNDP